MQELTGDPRADAYGASTTAGAVEASDAGGLIDNRRAMSAHRMQESAAYSAEGSMLVGYRSR